MASLKKERADVWCRVQVCKFLKKKELLLCFVITKYLRICQNIQK